jgi:NIMA (never in mitosis gene a)-related kinase
MNVFLASSQQVRIGDLGVAKVLSEHTKLAKTLVGTPYYLSPEVCEEKPYNEKSDVWALGCVLYELCTFKHPFEASNQPALFMKIIRGRYDPIVSNYSKDLIALIDQCLQKNPLQRPSTQQLL